LVMAENVTILTINGGSSSIKFSMFTMEEPPWQLYAGAVENIGSKDIQLSFNHAISKEKKIVPVEATNHDQAVQFLIDWLEKQEGFDTLRAIGHRIVHGMQHTEPERISPELMEELKAISAFDPEHLPGEIKLIEVFGERYPDIAQIACFDTSFHTTMPDVAKLLPLPRRYKKMAIERYGFHGLSYAYLMQELRRTSGNEAANGRVILAHLGNGASLAAVKNGKSMDTSMGFTPTSGLPMSTRTGDLDPGVAWYLMQHEKRSPKEFSHLINKESGLLGISETSSDMRELLQSRDTDHRAAEAVELFCYQTKKWIGSFAAVLGGLDTLVFSGGIGAHAPPIRREICAGLEFLGIELDETKNEKHAGIISAANSKVNVRVIETNEELMMAQLVIKNILNKKNMTIQLNTDKNLNIREQFGEKLETLLSEELSRYSEQITRLEVHFSDENGSKNGIKDKRCMLEARLEGLQPIAVKGMADTYEIALNSAIDKLKTVLDTTMGRLENH